MDLITAETQNGKRQQSAFTELSVHLNDLQDAMREDPLALSYELDISKLNGHSYLENELISLLELKGYEVTSRGEKLTVTLPQESKEKDELTLLPIYNDIIFLIKGHPINLNSGETIIRTREILSSLKKLLADYILIEENEVDELTIVEYLEKAHFELNELELMADQFSYKDMMTLLFRKNNGSLSQKDYIDYIANRILFCTLENDMIEIVKRDKLK